MNDRYLYKAKRKHDSKFFKKGEWVEGAYYIEPYTDKCFIIQWNSTGLGFNEFIEVDDESVCQCTGLKDKNGNLIWENDIVEAWSQERCAIGKIKHRIDGTWIMYPAWQNGEMWYLLPNDNGMTTVEIIGNIFDNPELLESEG